MPKALGLAGTRECNEQSRQRRRAAGRAFSLSAHVLNGPLAVLQRHIQRRHGDSGWGSDNQRTERAWQEEDAGRPASDDWLTLQL